MDRRDVKHPVVSSKILPRGTIPGSSGTILIEGSRFQWILSPLKLNTMASASLDPTSTNFVLEKPERVLTDSESNLQSLLPASDTSSPSGDVRGPRSPWAGSGLDKQVIKNLDAIPWVIHFSNHPFFLCSGCLRTDRSSGKPLCTSDNFL